MTAPLMTKATGLRVLEVLERIADLLEARAEQDWRVAKPIEIKVPPKGRTSRGGAR